MKVTYRNSFHVTGATPEMRYISSVDLLTLTGFWYPMSTVSWPCIQVGVLTIAGLYLQQKERHLGAACVLVDQGSQTRGPRASWDPLCGLRCILGFFKFIQQFLKDLGQWVNKILFNERRDGWKLIVYNARYLSQEIRCNFAPLLRQPHHASLGLLAKSSMGPWSNLGLRHLA